MPKNIVCPSGLAGTIRGLKAKEADMLADRQAAAKGTNIEDVLRNCWLSTNDPGPYAAAGPALNWSKVLYCDRYFTLLQVSAATFGDNYPFDVQCGNPRCGEPVEWEILISSLPVKELPAESRAKIAAGDNRFQAKTKSGVTVFFQLQDGSGERATADLLRANPKRQIVVAASSRILEIQGVHFNDRLNWVEDLELEEMHDLLEQFDAVDGGVETKIQVTCKCNWRTVADLPLEGLLVRRKARPA